MARSATDHREDVLKDIAIAKSDLRGRRDQAVSEFDERLQLLESIGRSVEMGELEPKVAQGRVRDLVNERPGMARAARAGRTRIGMQAPTALHPGTIMKAAPGSAAPLPAASPMLAQSKLTKLQQGVEQRIVAVMAQATDVRSRKMARLELALLLHMRRTVAQQSQEVPADAVLLQDLLQFADMLDGTLADLDAGGPRRVERLLEFDRHLLGQLRALGGTVAQAKEQIATARTMLGAGEQGLDKVLQTAIVAFDALYDELERLWPLASPSLLDEVVRLAT